MNKNTDNTPILGFWDFSDGFMIGEYLPKGRVCDSENKNRSEVLRLHFLQYGLANIKVKDYEEYSVFRTQYDSNGYYYVTNDFDADIKEFA